MPGDLIDGTFSEYAALMHHRYALRDIADESDVVLDDDDCQAARIEVLKYCPGLQCLLTRHSSCGFVEQDDVGPAARTMAISSHWSR